MVIHLAKARKYITSVFLTVSFIISAAGCGGEDDAAGSGAGTEGRTDYVSEYVDLGGEISDMAFYYGMQQYGDELCYLSNAQDKEQVLEKYSLADGSRSSVSFTWLAPGERHYIARFAFAGDGSIYAIVYRYPEAESESKGDSVPAKQLCGFDARGNQFFAIDVSERLNEESGSGISRMLAIDALGRIYMAGKTKIWLYEWQEGAEPDFRGEVSVCSGEESRIRSVICGKDGRVYACCSKGENISSTVYSLAQIDFDECRVGTVYEDFPGAGGIEPGMEKDFLVRDDTAAYEYDLASGTMEPVLNWMENDVAGSEVQHFGILTDGRIYAVTRDWGKDDSGIMLFSRAAGEEQTEQKEEIILACFAYNNRFQKAVADFNRNNDQYNIIMKEYEDDQKLLVDITSNCPDILDLNGLNVEQLAAAGVFEDLGAYLDGSRVLRRSDYLENVLDAYTLEGRLVTIPSSFWLQTVFAGKESLQEVFGDDFEGGWTVEELMAYADANPETELFNGLPRRSIMNCLMRYGVNGFIDWESGQCSFDSERFRNVLEFVGSFPDETAQNRASTQARIEAGEVLLAVEHINRFDGLQVYQEVFGGEAVCVGFPTPDGSVGCALNVNNALAISASSAHKEGAWKFMESYLADEEYEDAYDFVTNRVWLEKRMETALAAEYAAYDDGTPVVDKDGRYVMLNYSAYTVTYADGWTFSSHVPTEEEIQEVFALIGMACRPDSKCIVILNMINEEAEAFYRGQKSVEEAAEIIQRRSQLYLDENRMQ